MARPGLHVHPKFRRLVHLLNEPEAHCRGYLECLWEVGYEAGNPVLGDATDVELAARYPGAPGRLCKALLECRLIDDVTDVSVTSVTPVTAVTRYQIHDLFDHAPEYVRDRARYELERQKEKRCVTCGNVYHSKQAHARYCTNACKQASYRKRVSASADHVTSDDADPDPTLQTVTICYGPPAPAPAPAPTPINKERPRNAGAVCVFTSPTLEEVGAYCRERCSSVNPQAFVDFYTANGWVQAGGQPIRDWRAALRTWEHNGVLFSRNGNEHPPPPRESSAANVARLARERAESAAQAAGPEEWQRLRGSLRTRPDGSR